MTKFFRVKCRDCSFEKTARKGEKAENLLKSHQGQTGHIVTQKGPFYEAAGKVKWECAMCGKKENYPERVLEHIRTEHNPETVFLKKTNEVITTNNE